MNIDVRKEGNVTIATIPTIDGKPSELDGETAPQAQAQVLSLVEPDCQLLLDMSHVGYMSSAGLRMMLLIYRQIAAKKGQLILVGLSDDIKDTMELTGFLRFFQTAETLEAGLQTLTT
ncbi:MAG: STAS domain-containing protein [Ardenticatenaceae bacterium]